MRFILPLTVLAVLVSVLFATTVHALNEGYAFSGGYASHITPLATGLSLGFDYQAVIGKIATFNTVFQRSAEGSNSCSQCPKTSVDFFGAQIRFWTSTDFYFGPMAGIFSTTSSFGNSSGTVSGLGYGLVMGWEGEGRFFFSFQWEAANLSGDNTNEVEGIRFHFGYRFGADGDITNTPQPS